MTCDGARRMGLSRSALRHVAGERGWVRLAHGVYLTNPGPLAATTGSWPAWLSPLRAPP